MDRKSLFTGLLAGTLLSVFAVALFLGMPKSSVETSEANDYNGITLNPAYYVTLERDGEIIYEEEVTNVITNDGLNWVRDKLGSGISPVVPADYMALSNDSETAAATDTNLSVGQDAFGNGGEFVSGDASGLDRQQGAYTTGKVGNGNWTISYKWTATADFSVWKFGVFNGSALFVSATDLGDVMFSVGNFSANVSMQTNDELTVNVTYTVS